MGRQGWITGAGWWRLTALLGVGAVAVALLVALLSTPPGGASTEGTTRDGDAVHGTPVHRPGADKPYVGWGFTHTQFSADVGSATATDRVRKRLAKDGGLPQNQAIMGWGADNPEPVKGHYDFEALDRRIDFIRASGGIPVITLCCAPDWMKGGRPGVDNTDWSQSALETAPLPEHYKDFAALSATVAKRYPDVRHFIVWNEFKGFWNDAEGRWDYEGYTKLYNLVYTALKKVNPKNMVGGPYLVMDSVDPQKDANASTALRGPWGAMDQRVLDAFAYWNRHKAGADFVVVDGSSYTTKDDELLPDEFAATDKFTAVGRWVRQQTPGLPLWWAEYYVEPADRNDDRKRWSEPHRVAVQAAGLIAIAKGGATSGFYWNPQKRKGDCPGCLWTPTESSDGGRELPLYGLLSRFHREFPPGTAYRTVSVAPDDVPNVRVLASDRTVLVVNTLDRPISAKVDGRRFDMKAYEVKWLRR
ncbi:xylan 1,4-beta-xylosidase [Streptomyces sp. F-3]|nr:MULTISPECIES: xylan 1,4-beta-xylosidase [unclassified Streptomyces]MDN5382957.1 xylan 1,4-beta-xylosidase [Streptomyces sp. LB8]GAT82093.1 xylan 1,4-beta-xylosidase [Streptomyces sp. F-3]